MASMVITSERTRCSAFANDQSYRPQPTRTAPLCFSDMATSQPQSKDSAFAFGGAPMQRV